MASVITKKFAQHSYKILASLHWLIFFLNAIAEGFAIHFDEKRKCYWAAGIVMGGLVLFVLLEEIVIFRKVSNYEQNDVSKRSFYGTFNIQGFLVIIALISCIPGTIVPAVLGATYALNTDDNSTSTEIDDRFINIEENRTLGTLLSVISSISFVIMLKTLFLHEEIRNILNIPKDSK